MIKGILSLVLISCLLSAPAFAQRGCCSHHGGVSSCGSDGYEQCRDGSESPSCTCGNQQKTSYHPQQVKNGENLFSQNRPLNPYLEPVATEFVKLQS